MKGKATMALGLSLVVGLIINYGVVSPTAKVFATIPFLIITLTYLRPDSFSYSV